MTLLLGVYPSLITDVIGPSVEALLTQYDWRWRPRAAQPVRREPLRKPDMLGPDLAVILPEIVLSLFAMGRFWGRSTRPRTGSRPR
jgi:hypothetical protein